MHGEFNTFVFAVKPNCQRWIDGIKGDTPQNDRTITTATSRLGESNKQHETEEAA